jgi:mannosyltransferase OCH1-like enzyme
MYFLIIATIIVAIIIVLFYFYNLNIAKNNDLTLKNVSSNSLVNTNKTYFQEKNSKIPKIIIQTWKSNNVPQRYMSLINSVKDNNPDYEYLFFTDDSIEKFFKLHYPEYYNTYLTLPIKIQKIDFFRYVAVYHYGGFYLDLDMLVYKNFDPLLEYSCIFPVDEYIDVRHCKYDRYKLFCNRGQNFLLGQYAFAAEPKNPFIKKIIDTIHNNIHKYIKTVDFSSEDYIYKSTGPDFITEIFMDYPGKNDIVIIDNGIRQHFGDYAKHNYFGTWK